MYYAGLFWLPCLVTIAVILLSLLMLKKRGSRSATTATAGNSTSAASAAAADASSAPAPSSGYDSDSDSGGEYEVFLSFRGNDTRHGFTDFLYSDLVDDRIRTFRDDDELRVGEVIGPELLKAIKESKISVPIFSKGYASSKWCLRELAQMVECRTTMGQMILPIFYDVEPSDVRHQTGSYEEAFRLHEKHFDEKTVQGWKEALREVGQLKGWELKKETKG
ncbi:unnamed protein product [Ilex paraguariensis]